MKTIFSDEPSSWQYIDRASEVELDPDEPVKIFSVVVYGFLAAREVRVVLCDRLLQQLRWDPVKNIGAPLRDVFFRRIIVD